MNEDKKQKWSQIQGEESTNGFVSALQRFTTKNNVNMMSESKDGGNPFDLLAEMLTNSQNELGKQFMDAVEQSILDDSTMVKYAILYDDEALFRKAVRLIVHAATLNFLEDNRIQILSLIRKFRGLDQADPKATH